MRLYTILDKIAIILNVDHMVERGTSNGWNYVKYASGYIDAWRAVEYVAGKDTASLGTPVKMANADYSVHVTPSINGALASVFWIGDPNGNSARTTTAFSVSCRRSTERYSIYFNIYLHGRYK